jgi:Ser/Thr protein kinase RdoA (MazF antagonist)
VRRALDALPLAALSPGVCHGDLGPQNVFLDGFPDEGTATATLIDFDDCGRGFLAFDLGSVFMHLFLFRPERAEALWDIFLAAYRSQRDLAEVDIAAAPAFALARFLQVHGHDNPLGAVQARWPAAWYVNGSPWSWMLQCATTLESHLRS